MLLILNKEIKKTLLHKYFKIVNPNLENLVCKITIYSKYLFTYFFKFNP